MKNGTQQELQVPLCPSVPLGKHTFLLGTVAEDGLLHYIPERKNITEDFLAELQHTPQPEQGFRFAGECVQHKCPNWNGRICIVPVVVRQYIHIAMPEELLARSAECSIRAQCRWFQQEGSGACEVCPLLRAKPFLGTEELRYYSHEYKRIE